MSLLTTSAKIPLIVALAVGGVGVTVTAAFVLSNILTFGPTQLTFAVTLSIEQNLPSSASTNDENTIRVRIRSTQQVSNATIYLHLRSSTAQLTDPTIAEVKYKGPGESSFVVVPLTQSTSIPGVLQAALKTGWLVPQGIDGVGEAKVTFKSNAPSVTYYADVWVDGTLGATASPSTPTPTGTIPTSTPTPLGTGTATAPTSGGGTASFTLGTDRTPNRFTWTSGTNADATVPPDPTNINGWPLVVRTGQSVQITFNGLGGTHSNSVYPPTIECLAGYCAGAIVNGKDVAAGGTDSITFSYDTPGVSLYLVCNEHPGTMRTRISVIPSATGTGPAPTPTPTPTGASTATTPTSGGGTASFTLGTDRTPNRFTWVSGTNADATVPPNPTNINGWPLVVRAGQSVQITFNGLGGTHSNSVYPPTIECSAGYCAGAIVNGKDIGAGGTDSITFSYDTPGVSLYLVCNEHPGTMRTRISVIP